MNDYLYFVFYNPIFKITRKTTTSANIQHENGLNLNRFLKQKSQTGTFDLFTNAALDKSNESFKTAQRE